MNLAEEFYQALKERQYDFFTGIPDSWLKGLFTLLEAVPEYVPAVREDLALGLATGAYLAGKKPAVVMQNSGFGYSLEVFTSLHAIYRIPMLVVMSWRGKPGQKDHIEHQVMGQITEKTLAALGFPYFELSERELPALLDQTEEALVRDQTVFLLVEKGVFG